MNEILGPNTRVQWTTPKPGGWAGDGKGTLTNFDMERKYFGGKKGTGQETPGPAYEILLDAQGDRAPLTVWVAPDEVVAL